MTDNLPAVRTEAPSTAIVARDTDSWAQQLPAIVDLARSICGTDFVPEALRNNIPATAAAMLYGREVGLPPLTALGNVNVIKGKPGLSAVIMRAQVLAAGHEIRQDESNNGLCKMSGRRRGTDYWQTVTYTIDDARQAGLLQQNKNYEKNPRRMLRARATSELCELMFADVVRGMPSLEELEEADDDVQAGPAAKTARATVQRKRSAKVEEMPAAPAAAPATTAAPPMPPLPGEPGYDEVTGATPDASAKPDMPADEPLEDASSEVENQEVGAVEEPRMISRAQQRAMHAVFNQLGITDKAERLHITAAIVGRTPMDHATGQPSSNGLTADEATTLTGALNACKDRDQVEALVQLAEQQRAETGE